MSRAATITAQADRLMIYPAIDLRNGRCVRLYQGDYSRETVYGEDPVAQARAFATEGAEVLHVVDLDAALTGEPTNTSVIGDIVAGAGLPVQVGGGVRDRGAAESLFELGVARVVVGTAALERPELVAELVDAGRSVAVGLDAHGDEVATHGWTARSGRKTRDVAQQFAELGVDALVVTEIDRDGTMAGPDLGGLAELLAMTETTVIASGGVGQLGHVEALRRLRSGGRALGGVIVGRALYEGEFKLAEAIRAGAEED